MTGRVTIRMIAELTHCSTATVSTVLNGSRGNTKVSDSVRDTILSTAHQLHYQPNLLSRNLRLGVSKTIGIYVQPKPWHGLSFGYEMSIFRGIEEVARGQGYDILVLNISSDALPEVCSQRFREGRIDGVILLHCQNGSWVDELLDISPNVVGIEFTESHPRLNRVFLDNEAALSLAIQYLRKKGHRRIGFAANLVENADQDFDVRLFAFKRLAAEAECEDVDLLTHDVTRISEPLKDSEPFCQESGRLAMRYFAGLPKPPTAVIAFDSLAAVALIQEARRMNISVPGQLSVMGIDRTDMGEMNDPPLTVIDHQCTEMGRMATRTLINQINQKKIPDVPFVGLVQPALWEGGTVKKLNMNP